MPDKCFLIEFEERFASIRPYVDGKVVLDIGCGGTKNSFSLLHERISSVAKENVGIEINRKFVEIMKKHGHNVVLADAENFNLGRKFDVIVAGEIIEHLSNFKGFLESCARHMRKDSKLIITTPNVFNIDNIYVIFLKKILPKMGDHTVWFDEYVIKNLLEKNGFRVEKIDYVIRTKIPATKYLRYKTLVVVASLR